MSVNVNDYVQFRNNLTYSVHGVSEGLVMKVKEIDHYDGRATVNVRDQYNEWDLTFPFHTYKDAVIEYPSTMSDSMDADIKHEMRMERAHDRRIWKALCEIYSVNAERISIVDHNELMMGMFKLTIQKIDIHSVAQHVPGNVDFLMYAYASMSPLYREDMFTRHMAELMHIASS